MLDVATTPPPIEAPTLPSLDEELLDPHGHLKALAEARQRTRTRAVVYFIFGSRTKQTFFLIEKIIIFIISEGIYIYLYWSRTIEKSASKSV